MDMVGSRILWVEVGFEAWVETGAGAQQWEWAPAGEKCKIMFTGYRSRSSGWWHPRQGRVAEAWLG